MILTIQKIKSNPDLNDSSIMFIYLISLCRKLHVKGWRIPDSGCWVSDRAPPPDSSGEKDDTPRSTSSPWPRRDLWPSQRDSLGSAASVQQRGTLRRSRSCTDYPSFPPGPSYRRTATLCHCTATVSPAVRPDRSRITWGPRWTSHNHTYLQVESKTSIIPDSDYWTIFDLILFFFHVMY